MENTNKFKIIIAPSKTQSDEKVLDRECKEPAFIEKANVLAEGVSKFAEEEIASIMKLKGKLLDETYQKYKNFKGASGNHVIASYTGMVFKGIEVKDYSDAEFDYLGSHLVVLSALYGPLNPFDCIKPYRLDMKMKVMDESLYNYWTEDVTGYLEGAGTIINLASSEFSKLVKLPMITIDFKEAQWDGKYKLIGTYAKMARGLMVNYIVRNGIEDIEEIKGFDLEGYSFNKEISSDGHWIFTR